MWVCYYNDFAGYTWELSGMSRAGPWWRSLLSEAAVGGGVSVAQMEEHSVSIVLDTIVTSLRCLLSLCCFPVHITQDQT